MSPDQWRFRVEDILHAINAELEYTSGLDFEMFAADR